MSKKTLLMYITFSFAFLQLKKKLFVFQKISFYTLFHYLTKKKINVNKPSKYTPTSNTNKKLSCLILLLSKTKRILQYVKKMLM